MSVLSRDQRHAVRVSTSIDPILIDRVADAYDALMKGNLDQYKQHMLNAYTQQNLPWPIPASERPTAVDKVKTICIKSIADEKHWSFSRTARWIEEVLKG